MHQEITYFLQLLGAFVRGEPAPQLPLHTDTDHLLRIAQHSNLSGVLGYMLLPQAKSLDAEVFARFSRHFYKTVAVFSNRNHACATLQKQLLDADIPHALLKGAVLHALYPAKELRTFGDIDVYIPPAYVPRLRTWLADSGDTITHEDDHQICISRPPLFVEFHFSLCEDAVDTLPALTAYLRDPAPHMQYCEPLRLHTVDMPFHFIYLLAHQMRHFDTDSPGIRSFLDLAILLKSGYITDTAVLTRTLKEVGLYTYAATALTLVERWFGVPSPLGVVSLSDSDIAFLEEYLFSAGQFASEQSPRTHQVLEQRAHRFPRLRAVWVSLFPPADYMRSEKRYAALSARFLPAAYIYRLFRGAFCRTAFAVSSARAISSAADDANARARALAILGGLSHEER